MTISPRRPPRPFLPGRWRPCSPRHPERVISLLLESGGAQHLDRSELAGALENQTAPMHNYELTTSAINLDAAASSSPSRSSRRQVQKSSARATRTRASGSGPPLLLVHGTGSYADLWSPVLDGLARAYRVIAYDRRGFARSSSTPGGGLAEHARDAAALLNALGASPATVVGGRSRCPVSGTCSTSTSRRAGSSSSLRRPATRHRPQLCQAGTRNNGLACVPCGSPKLSLGTIGEFSVVLCRDRCWVGRWALRRSFISGRGRHGQRVMARRKMGQYGQLQTVRR